MKENFSILAKEIHFYKSRKLRESQGFCTKEAHTKTYLNYITQDSREEENLKSSKTKGDSYLQRSSLKTIS